MTQATSPLTFTVSLALSAHHHAETFRQYHHQPAKAKQVYLNTLAVYAVHDYLNYIGIATGLDTSPSWDPLQQSLLDTASLQISQVGLLECRPVLPGATMLTWPPETPDSSLGIVAVQLSESLREANLLGFVPPDPNGAVSLSDLQSLEILGAQLSARQHPTVVRQQQPAPVPLSQWWDNLADEVWQVVSGVVEEFTSLNYAFEFRGAPDTPQPPHSAPIVSRVKHCQLGAAPQGLAVDLLVGLQPEADQEINVYVQIKAAEPHLRLLENLQMAVLDAAGTQVMQAQSLGTEALQMKFSTVPGEQFQLQLTLNDISLTETFLA